MIKKKIITIGNSLGIIIPKAVLDALSISTDDTLSLKIEGNGIKIEKIVDEINEPQK